MQFYYGEKNILRALDEAEFWKHQEAEHTQVIQAVTPGLEINFVKELQEFEVSFNKTRSYLVRFIESCIRSKETFDEELKVEMLKCANYCIRQSDSFVMFLEKLLIGSQAVQRNFSSQVVINHIIRESQYFIGIEQLIL